MILFILPDGSLRTCLDSVVEIGTIVRIEENSSMLNRSARYYIVIELGINFDSSTRKASTCAFLANYDLEIQSLMSNSLAV